jgi:hypothetical protein
MSTCFTLLDFSHQTTSPSFVPHPSFYKNREFSEFIISLYTTQTSFNMFKLVVLSAVLALACAKPSGITHGAVPVTYTASIPAVSAAVSHQTRTDYISSPVVTSYAATPIVRTAEVVATAPVVKTTLTAGPAVTHYAAVPVTGTAYTKNVHYAEKDVVTGYTSQIYKPNLGALATPLQTVSQEQVLAPARAVQTITPTVTQVQPEVTVKKYEVDVPVKTPVVSEVEVRTPVVAAAPIAKVAAAVPAVSSYSYSVSAPAAVPVAKFSAVAPTVQVAAAPAVSSYSYSVASPPVATRVEAVAPTVAAAPIARVAAVAPAVSSYSYSVAAPAIATKVAAAAPAVSSYSYSVSAPAVASRVAAVAPAVAAAPVAQVAAVAPAVSGYSYSVSAPAAVAVAPAYSTYSIAAPAIASRTFNVPSAISTNEIRQSNLNQW